MQITVGVAGSALAIAFDSIVLIFTLARTLRLAWQTRRLGVKESLSMIILRDGRSNDACLFHMMRLTIRFDRIVVLLVRQIRSPCLLSQFKTTKFQRHRSFDHLRHLRAVCEQKILFAAFDVMS